MSPAPTFELLRASDLRIHEEIDPSAVASLAERIRAEGVVREPIWVARGSGVILNGHHRFAALQRLGAERIPAWVVDYTSTEVVLDRWNEGPPIAKSEVVDRARSGRPFPPKTTRHTILFALPPHPTALAELLDGAPPGGEARSRARAPREAAP
ncbi:MAG TPA: ParB N-terminal domain-containing protein [Thermoplasmata archaeon]|nr:ParB N-terminal domain-containing protein [Thermoplasmata archaeon]